MNIVTITKDNIEHEHICCAISNNKDSQVMAKKSWMSERFEDGLVFKKGDVRGKCFIEYIPAEKAWCPIEADDYMYIDCFWVSGQYKGQGNANLLLDECMKDCKEKGKKGLVVLSSQKKMPFLSDSRYLKYKGFKLADSVKPFELLYLAFNEDSHVPRFKENAKKLHISKPGFVLYFSKQCPFTVKYVPLIEQVAMDKNIPFTSILFETAEQAQNAPAPCTSFCLFFNGEFITNEILSVKKFEKLIAEKGL
ncbi:MULTISPECIES: N-acetyltransferase [Bacillus]|uniref:N-acetyltransferase n=1 Tax=Bacillus TaxID=1386 RepID=UPI0002E01C7A|nr:MULTISPECIES: GNAT family N-acetyltransferase [Bacillus]